MAKAQNSGIGAYHAASKMSIKDVRKLRIGDILKAQYVDSPDPVYLLVVEDPETDAIHDQVRTMALSFFTYDRPTRVDRNVRTSHWINTDKYTLVGRMSFELLTAPEGFKLPSISSRAV